MCVYASRRQSQRSQSDPGNISQVGSVSGEGVQCSRADAGEAAALGHSAVRRARADPEEAGAVGAGESGGGCMSGTVHRTVCTGQGMQLWVSSLITRVIMAPGRHYRTRWQKLKCSILRE